MKLFSFKGLTTGITRSFVRFPLAIITAIVGTVFAVYALEYNYLFRPSHFWVSNIIHVCLVGMTLFISIVLFGERRGWSRFILFILQLCAAGLVVLYYFTLPVKILESNILRSFLFAGGFHLLVSFAPFIGYKEVNGFWQFNKALFLRFLTSALYSGVLYLGLSLAILAIDNLFKIKIHSEIYAELWFILVGVFNTWFFLAGVPEKPGELNESSTYPLGLKIFTQYVLIPLVSLYLIILYAYMAKIIIEWQWPVGWVSWLVIGFSVSGIFSLLLVYPIQFNEGNRWIRVYSRAFYFALLPLVVLLSLAIWKRISEYGITENRYYVVVLAVWLLGISVYLLMTKLKNIRMIPVSLCVIALLSSFGPWGSFSISLHDQKSRLEEVLVKNKLLVKGKFEKTNDTIPLKDNEQISSIVDYIVSVHGYKEFQPWSKVRMDTLFVDSLYRNETYEILTMMGLEYISVYDIVQHISENFYFSISDGKFIARKISGYDIYFPYQTYFYTSYENSRDTIHCTWVTAAPDSFGVTFSSADLSLQIGLNDSVGIKLALDTLVEGLRLEYPGGNGMTKQNNSYDLKPERMTLTGRDSNFMVKVVFNRLNGQVFEGKRVFLNNLDADIYIHWLKDTIK
jgi:hypothetical protein